MSGFWGLACRFRCQDLGVYVSTLGAGGSKASRLCRGLRIQVVIGLKA